MRLLLCVPIDSLFFIAGLSETALHKILDTLHDSYQLHHPKIEAYNHQEDFLDILYLLSGM